MVLVFFFIEKKNSHTELLVFGIEQMADNKG